MSIAIVALFVVAPAVASELALRGTKVQTRLGPVAAIWGATYGLALAALGRGSLDRELAVTIFWTGAFLVWFGVRSHVESSITLRLVHLLRQHPMTDTALVAEYRKLHDESHRVAELCRGRLVAAGPDGRVHVTPKGKVVLSLVAKLR